MLGYEEKVERLELLDAVADAGRLARVLMFTKKWSE